jgi:hypothetical protein
LIDFVCNSAEPDASAGHGDIIKLKRWGFECVLAAEKEHLPHCADLVRPLRRGVAAMARVDRTS